MGVNTGEHPECHGEAAVDEGFDIDATDLWVELHSPIVIEYDPCIRDTVMLMAYDCYDNIDSYRVKIKTRIIIKMKYY